MTARAISSVLDPLSSSTLNRLHEAVQPPSKKRKIGLDDAAGQLSTTSIVIRVSYDSSEFQHHTCSHPS